MQAQEGTKKLDQADVRVGAGGEERVGERKNPKQLLLEGSQETQSTRQTEAGFGNETQIVSQKMPSLTSPAQSDAGTRVVVAPAESVFNHPAASVRRAGSKNDICGAGGGPAL